MTDIKVSTFTERFNELVADLAAHGIQRAEVAKRLGVSKQTISAWVTGERSPKRPTIVAIAKTYDVSIAWLHGFDVPKKAQTPAPTADERAEKFTELFSKLSEEEQITIIQAMKGIAEGK